MTHLEFLNDFNFRFNNLFSNQAPGLNSYEISLVLTQAQDDILKAYCNPKGNKFQEGYDMSPKRQIDFSKITDTIKCKETTDGDKLVDDSPSVMYSIPNNILQIINEVLKVQWVEDGKTYTKNLQVVPLLYTDLEQLFSEPFHEPTKNKAWRIITTGIPNMTLDDNNKNISTVQLFYHTGETPKAYTIRYIRKPYPIIVEDLEQYGLSIDGYTYSGVKVKDSTRMRDIPVEDEDGNPIVSVPRQYEACELPEELHTEIVQRAVELAKSMYQGNLADMITVGNQSSTNLGIIPNTK